MEEPIHIQWEGPFLFNTVLIENHSSIDYGIYQVHGHHPIYGKDSLLYIGRAQKRPFGVRLNEEGWDRWQQANGTIHVYLGRLAGPRTPDPATWQLHIARVERLLIAAHRPAHNASGLYRNNDPNVGTLHILNWGNRGALLPEVSGARWSSRFDIISNYDFYGNHENNPYPESPIND